MVIGELKYAKPIDPPNMYGVAILIGYFWVHKRIYIFETFAMIGFFPDDKGSKGFENFGTKSFELHRWIMLSNAKEST